jgi:hypothetical protein
VTKCKLLRGSLSWIICLLWISMCRFLNVFTNFMELWFSIFLSADFICVLAGCFVERKHVACYSLFFWLLNKFWSHTILWYLYHLLYLPSGRSVLKLIISLTLCRRLVSHFLLKNGFMSISWNMSSYYNIYCYFSSTKLLIVTISHLSIYEYVCLWTFARGYTVSTFLHENICGSCNFVWCLYSLTSIAKKCYCF